MKNRANYGGENMRLYLAPLEGITGWIYRNAVHSCFGGFERYYIPFIKPNQQGHFSAREKKDVLQEHNNGMDAVPQILTNSAEDFLKTASKLKNFYGYDEVNLNLGCPSKTVVVKGRGAGFLAEQEKLKSFLDNIFEKCETDISIKTRIGMEDPEEFDSLIEIYNGYPVKELIIHPRVQKDFYKNVPRLDVFEEAFASSKNPVCYNGDLFSAKEMENFQKRFPEVETAMLGRGILANPALAREINEGKPATKEELRKFHDMLYEGYCKEMSGDRTILFKMKEMWSYMAPILTEHKKYAKKIKKCERCTVYEQIAEEFFAASDVQENTLLTSRHDFFLQGE